MKLNRDKPFQVGKRKLNLGFLVPVLLCLLALYFSFMDNCIGLFCPDHRFSSLATTGSEFMFLAIIQSKTILESKNNNNNKQNRKTLTSIKYNYQTFIEVFSLWLFSIHHFVAIPLYIATFILNYSCTFPQLYLSFCQLCPIFKHKYFNVKMLKII